MCAADCRSAPRYGDNKAAGQEEEEEGGRGGGRESGRRDAIGRGVSRPHRRLRQQPAITPAAGTNQPTA